MSVTARHGSGGKWTVDWTHAGHTIPYSPNVSLNTTAEVQIVQQAVLAIDHEVLADLLVAAHPRRVSRSARRALIEDLRAAIPACIVIGETS